MIESRPYTGTNLSDSERLRRIAELLCKAILRTEAKSAVAGPAPEPFPGEKPERPAFMDSDDKADDKRVLQYLHFVGSASPATIRGTLGMSRSGTHRVLFHLTRAGRIVGCGQTRALVYRLNETEPSPDKILLN